MNRPLICVIDDSRTYRELYKLLLKNEFELVMFESYDACLVGEFERQPRLFICDLVVPGMCAWEGIRLLEYKFPDSQFLVASCLDTDKQKDAADILNCKFWPKRHLDDLKHIMKDYFSGGKTDA